MRRSLCTMGLLLLSSTAAAEPIAAGGVLPSFRLTDQHEATYELGHDVRVLVVTHDMDAGGIVRDTLADTPQAALDARGIVYVADISRMPALVSRLMAVPRMRRRSYRVFLDRDGAATRDLPSAEGKATVVRLDDLRIVAIEQIGDGASLRAVLFPSPP